MWESPHVWRYNIMLLHHIPNLLVYSTSDDGVVVTSCGCIPTEVVSTLYSISDALLEGSTVAIVDLVCVWLYNDIHDL